MFSLDTLFIIIVSVMVLSLVLAVADWIYIATLGSKIATLERDVDKKSLEFDAFKKDRTFSREPAAGAATVIESNEPLADSPPPEEPGEETIQIVRNVRGNFEESSAFNASSTNDSEEHHGIAAPPDTSIGTLEYSTVVPYHHENHQEEVSSPQEQQPPPPPPPPQTEYFTATTGQVNPANYPDNSSTQGAAAYQTETLRPQVLYLYSDATKDADFQLLWKNINEILQQQPNATITVDLSGIHFMYEKEMEYLEKINYLLTGQGGALTFNNCDAELLELINQRPRLRELVQQNSV